MRGGTKAYISFAVLGLAALCVWQVHARASDASGFPDGYDAVQTAPIHAGHWSVHWMKPEPMHAIESVENNPKPGDLPLLRVEIKVGT
jgi:hypothetical protein